MKDINLMKFVKKELPSPITDENFQVVWDYANNKQIEIKQKKLNRKIILFVSNIVFFLCATSITLSLLLHLSDPLITAYLDSLGPIMTLVTIADPIIYHPDLHIIVQVIIYLIYLLGAPFLASALVSLIVWLAYRPAAPNTATGDNAADSKTLVDSLFEIQVRGKKVDGIASMAFVALYIVELLAITLSIFAFMTTNPDVLTNDSIVPTVISTLMVNPLAPYAYVLGYGIFAVINEFLSNLLKPFYRTTLDSKIQADAKNYYYESNPAIKEAYEEEERILKRAIEIRAKRKQEEAELMAKINYKNPIYKYIRIGVTTLILILALVFAANKLKDFDLNKFLNNLGSESIESTESTETEGSSEVTNE